MTTPTPEVTDLYRTVFMAAVPAGISHWAEVVAVALPHDFNGFRAAIDVKDDTGESEAGAPALTIDRRVIERGMALLAKRETEQGERVAAAFREPLNVVSFDTRDADCVVQLGLFKSIVYPLEAP